MCFHVVLATTVLFVTLVLSSAGLFSLPFASSCPVNIIVLMVLLFGLLFYQHVGASCIHLAH